MFGFHRSGHILIPQHMPIKFTTEFYFLWAEKKKMEMLDYFEN